VNCTKETAEEIEVHLAISHVFIRVTKNYVRLSLHLSILQVHSLGRLFRGSALLFTVGNQPEPSVGGLPAEWRTGTHAAPYNHCSVRAETKISTEILTQN